MIKYILGSCGYALFVTDRPVEGVDVYREITDEQAERLKQKLDSSGRVERIHFTQLDVLLE